MNSDEVKSLTYLSAELQPALLQLGHVLLNPTQLRLQPNHFPCVEAVQQLRMLLLLLLLLKMLLLRMPSVTTGAATATAAAHPVQVLMQRRYLRFDPVDLHRCIFQTFTAQRQQRVDLTKFDNSS